MMHGRLVNRRAKYVLLLTLLSGCQFPQEPRQEGCPLAACMPALTAPLADPDGNPAMDPSAPLQLTVNGTLAWDQCSQSSPPFLPEDPQSGAEWKGWAHWDGTRVQMYPFDVHNEFLKFVTFALYKRPPCTVTTPVQPEGDPVLVKTYAVEMRDYISANGCKSGCYQSIVSEVVSAL